MGSVYLRQWDCFLFDYKWNDTKYGAVVRLKLGCWVVVELKAYGALNGYGDDG